jgi:hypothetical protein
VANPHKNRCRASVPLTAVTAAAQVAQLDDDDEVENTISVGY